MSTPQQPLDWRYRSLLYKAVRRGYAQLVVTTCAWVNEQGALAREWLREQAVGITFEECWPAARHIILNRHYHSKVAALVRVAGREKDKDAAGLAALAMALSGGESSVLAADRQDRDVKIVANAIARGDDFWAWVVAQPMPEARLKLVKMVRRFAKLGRPEQQARAIAAAYLAETYDIPPAPMTAPVSGEFPYWIALDQHTREGRLVLREVARDLHLSPQLVAWCLFYFEGSRTNQLSPSPLWQRYCRWRFGRFGMSLEEARLVWHPLRPQIEEALQFYENDLHREIYRWKQEHLGQVALLREQVETFNDNLSLVGPRQKKIFE